MEVFGKSFFPLVCAYKIPDRVQEGMVQQNKLCPLKVITRDERSKLDLPSFKT